MKLFQVYLAEINTIGTPAVLEDKDKRISRIFEILGKDNSSKFVKLIEKYQSY